MFYTFSRSLVCFVILCLCVFSESRAQGVPPDSLHNWNVSGSGALNFSQVSLSNWAAGGQNSVSVLGTANLYANYKKGSNTWENVFSLTYGTVKLQGQRVRKSDDRFELNLKYGRNASTDWYYTAQLNLKTQLTPTYTVTRDTLLSDFFSPAAVLASLGMDYKPTPVLSVFISPFTGKFTIVKRQILADQGLFGVAPAEKDLLGNPIIGTGNHIRKEFGGYVNIRFKKEVLTNVTLQSKLDLFSNYLKNAKNVDMNWENLIGFKVNKFISASLFAHLIYDDDVKIDVDRNGDNIKDGRGSRLQFKETLGIGISYKFE